MTEKDYSENALNAITAFWMICITDKSTQKTIMVQHCDRKKVFAMAYDRLTNYLSETKGGY